MLIFADSLSGTALAKSNGPECVAMMKVRALQSYFRFKTTWPSAISAAKLRPAIVPEQ
jgi:hypothetical protein